MATAAASDNIELGPITPAAGGGRVVDHEYISQYSEQEESTEQVTGAAPRSDTPRDRREYRCRIDSINSKVFGISIGLDSDSVYCIQISGPVCPWTLPMPKRR